MARIFTDGGAQKLISAVQRLTNDLDWSVAFWINRTATPAAARTIITAADATATPGWVIRLTTGNLIQAAVPYSTADKVRTSTSIPALNAWTHVIVTHHNTGLANTDLLFYFNGKSEAGTATTTGSGTHDQATAVAIEVGASTADASSAPPMQLGPIAIWNRAISPAEALALAGGMHPIRYKEGLLELFDLDTAAGEEGWFGKIYLVQGATNPTSAAVSPAVEQPPALVEITRDNVHSRLRTRARYFAGVSALNAVMDGTLVLTSTSVATDPEAATAAATLVLTSTSAATDPEVATASGTLVLSSTSAATAPESATASGTLVLTSTSAATDPEVATTTATLILTSASAAVAPEVATTAATLVLLSTADATTGGASLATAAATLVLTSTSAAVAPEAADAVATLTLASASAATDPEVATAAGTLVLLSDAQASDDRFATAAGLLTLIVSATAGEIVTPPDTGITGAIWGWWDRYNAKLERRQREREAQVKPPLSATAKATLRLVGSAQAERNNEARHAGYLRLVGSAAAHVDMSSWEEDELLLLAALLEAAAA